MERTISLGLLLLNDFLVLTLTEADIYWAGSLLLEILLTVQILSTQHDTILSTQSTKYRGNVDKYRLYCYFSRILNRISRVFPGISRILLNIQGFSRISRISRICRHPGISNIKDYCQGELVRVLIPVCNGFQKSEYEQKLRYRYSHFVKSSVFLTRNYKMTSSKLILQSRSSSEIQFWNLFCFNKSLLTASTNRK